MMVVESFVTNIIAAIAYDKGKRVVREMFSPQEKELEKALKEYLNDQMSQFGQDGASIIEAIPLLECTGELYREIIASGADSDYILDQ